MDDLLQLPRMWNKHTLQTEAVAHYSVHCIRQSNILIGGAWWGGGGSSILETEM